LAAQQTLIARQLYQGLLNRQRMKQQDERVLHVREARQQQEDTRAIVRSQILNSFHKRRAQALHQQIDTQSRLLARSTQDLEKVEAHRRERQQMSTLRTMTQTLTKRHLDEKQAQQQEQQFALQKKKREIDKTALYLPSLIGPTTERQELNDHEIDASLLALKQLTEQVKAEYLKTQLQTPDQNRIQVKQFR